MNKSWLVTSITAVLLAACSADPAGVGSYVASEQDGAMMVQITSIDAGRVTGTLSMVSADNHGKTSAVTRPLSGTLEGEALNLTIDNAAVPSLITGTLDGDALRLTFFGRENSSEVVFTRSDAAKFNALVADTRQHAAATKLGLEADAAQQDRITRRAKTQAAIDRDADRLLAKAQELSEKLKRLDVITAQHRALHDRIAKLQAAQRTTDSGTSDGAYRASQIDYELSRLRDDMETPHRSVEAYGQSLRDFADDAASLMGERLAECEADKLLDCSRLTSGFKLFHTRYAAFSTAQSREKAAFAGSGKRT